MTQLGYRFDLEDKAYILEHSSKFSLRMLGNEPEEIDPRPWFKIRSQGSLGSCRGHSLAANARYCAKAAAGELDLNQDGIKNDPKEDDFSPMWSYIMSQRQSNIRGDVGATMTGGIKVGIEQGIAREALWPYSGVYNTSVPRGSSEDASKFKFARYTKFMPGDVQGVKAWLATGQGGIDWGKMWPLPFIAGCLVDGPISNRTVGGHATAILGYIKGRTLLKEIPTLGNKIKEDQTLFVGVNSHGTNAQDKGFYYVTEKGLEACMRHQWTEVLGWSDMSVPKRRTINFNEKGIMG
jgi:hypothetical protein